MATWHLGYHLSICSWTQENQEKNVSRWPVAGPSGLCPLEWSASRPGRTLPPGKTRYPLYRRLGGTQGRCGRAENLAPSGFDPRTVQPVAQSLYRLSYLTHISITCRAVKCGLCCSLYGRETLYFVLQGKHGLRVWESRGQREVFGCKENEVTGDWRKLRN